MSQFSSSSFPSNYTGKQSANYSTKWHSPWDHSRLEATQTHRVSSVPIYDFTQENTEPHFADPDIRTDVEIHLKLRIHDFPGELNAQRSIREQAEKETLSLRDCTGKNLGVVLICMFDAEEASTGLSKQNVEYYTGELFANLRSLVAHKEVAVERLILDFNKYDKLRSRWPNKEDRVLLTECIGVYEPIISLLRGICNPEKVCEVFTVLDREDIVYNNRGTSIVLGEAARRFVEVMAGNTAIEEIVPNRATSYTAAIFS